MSFSTYGSSSSKAAVAVAVAERFSLVCSWDGAWTDKENEERFYEFSVMALLRTFLKWLSVSAYSAMNPRSANCAETIALRSKPTARPTAPWLLP